MPASSLSGTFAQRSPRHRAALPVLPKPTAPRTLPEQIADSLRQAILRGRLCAGAHLVEASIAKQMRTSRGPVRDALLLLERDGLVVKLANRGTRVLDFDERTLREAATLRATLEEFAITLLVPRLTAGDLERLGVLFRRMESAARRGAVREFNQVDFLFHDAIIEACGHRTLHEAWKSMQRRIRAFQGSSNWVSGDLEAVARRHRVILQALVSRKLRGAHRALRAHFGHLQAELDVLFAHRESAGGARSGAQRSAGRTPMSRGQQHAGRR